MPPPKLLLVLQTLAARNWKNPGLCTYIPGWTGHVHGDSTQGVNEESVRVPLRNVLAHVEVAFRDALHEGVERLWENLASRKGRAGAKVWATRSKPARPLRPLGTAKRNVTRRVETIAHKLSRELLIVR